MSKLKLIRRFINCTNKNLWFSVPDTNSVLYAQTVTTFESVTYNNKITPVSFINGNSISNVYIVDGIIDAIKLAMEVDVNLEEVYEPCREEMKKVIWAHLDICYKLTSLRSVGTFTKLLMKGARLFGTRNQCGMCGVCVCKEVMDESTK